MENKDVAALSALRPALPCLLAFLLAVPLSADPEWGVKLDPVAIFPWGNTSGLVKNGQAVDLYSLGYGFDVSASALYGGLFGPYARFGFSSVPLNGVAGSSLVSQQATAGLFVSVNPLPRLVTTLGAGGGLAHTAFSTADGEVVGGLAPQWSVAGEVGYRFTPSFSLSGLASYSQTLGTESAIFKGVSVGLRINLGLDLLGGGGSGVTTEVRTQSRLFPIAYYKSENVPLATVSLVNTDAAEIRDVTVTFSAGDYTSRDAPCAEFPILLHNQAAEVPVFAVFNDKVLGFTETTKIQGEIKISYKILDAVRVESKVITVVFNNRNTALWSDPRVVGAFVSPQDPVMLELSKYVAGLVRVRAIPEIDKALQYAMGMFEGLRLYGLVWGADPASPYTEVRQDPGRLAYIQFPSQTLSYKSGDSDALALTVAEALVSIAVPAAIAAFPEDVIVAFPLDMGESQARATFTNLKNFIFESGKVWVPLRASLIRDGFLRAWQGGVELWQSQPPETRAPLVKLEDAWREFSPIALPPLEFNPIKPSETAVNQAFDKVVARFAQTEVDPKVQKFLAGVTGELTPVQHNSLGIIYAQYGFYDQAKSEFEMAVSLDYAPAVINLANVAFLKKEYAVAAAGFEKAMSNNQRNKNVLLGLARAQYELGEYEQANALFLQVKALDPALAERYSYLAFTVGSGVEPGSERSGG